MHRQLGWYMATLLFAVFLINVFSFTAYAQNVSARQNCEEPVLAPNGDAHIHCKIVIAAPDILPDEKLSLQYHIRPGYDVSLPGAIPNASKSGVTFSSQEPWECVSQGAPQPPGHGCFLYGKDLLAAKGITSFETVVVILNPQDARDIQSCFRLVGAGADRTQQCIKVEMGMPEAQLRLEKMCEPAWSDGSFINIDCTTIIDAEHLLPATYVRFSTDVRVGNVIVRAKVLEVNTSGDWECEGANCVLDSDVFVSQGQSSSIHIKSRIPVPHVDGILRICSQVTTRTPRLAADQTCFELGGDELTR